MPEVNAVLEHMREFSDAVRSGAWTGYTGKRDHRRRQHRHRRLRPRPGHGHRGAQALRQARPATSTSSRNVDGTHIAETLRKLNPETALFIVASKTFTTQETITNAHDRQGVVPQDRRRTRSTSPSTSSPSRPTRRRSRSSASTRRTCSRSGTGSAAATRCGRRSACRSRCPSAWTTSRSCSPAATRWTSTSARRRWRRTCRSILGAAGHLVQRLLRRPDARDPALRPVHAPLRGVLPAGRHGVQRQERHAATASRSPTTRPARSSGASRAPTASTPSTSSSTRARSSIPCDFLAPVETHNPVGEHHPILLSNFFAQTEALMKGKTADEVRAELTGIEAVGARSWRRWCRRRCSQGNRPTNSILFQKLTPRTLGLADRDVRAQDLHAGRDLEHQQLRPVGRRAGQAAGQGDPAGAGRRRAR